MTVLSLIIEISILFLSLVFACRVRRERTATVVQRAEARKGLTRHDVTGLFPLVLLPPASRPASRFPSVLKSSWVDEGCLRL